MASAAALTLGAVTIPVYEIYKVGEEPRWLEGLDLLGPATGLRAAVVPHYDNAEGGTPRHALLLHGRASSADPRAGAARRRLHPRRGQPHGAGARPRAPDRGRVRPRRGHGPRRRPSAVVPSGSEVPIEALDGGGARARGRRAGRRRRDGDPGRRPSGAAARRGPRVPRPRCATRWPSCEGSFIEALDRGDTRAAVEALLDLDSAITARIRHGEDSPDLDNASATFRSLIARLGEQRRGRRRATPARCSTRSCRRCSSCAPGPAPIATGRPPTSSATGWPRPGSRSATTPTARAGS